MDHTTQKLTEKLHDCAIGLDQRPPLDIAKLIAESQIAAVKMAQTALPAICTGAHAMADCIRAGGKLVYAAAGSSGLMALADASELSGTFGIENDKVHIIMAGGIPVAANMTGKTEDDIRQLPRYLTDFSDKDLLIALSASGSTPYTLEAAKIAAAKGMYVIGIANNPGTSLLAHSDCAIMLPTEAEIISGSTRMGAATAQKIALNTLSTLMAIELGHVYDGMMVNLIADNIKLRERASNIVATIAHISSGEARDMLEQSNGNVKLAVLLSACNGNKQAAAAVLTKHNGNLRKALNDPAINE